jgi:hypothetical protein
LKSRSEVISFTLLSGIAYLVGSQVRSMVRRVWL